MKKAFSLEVLPVRLIDVGETLLHATAQNNETSRGGIHFMVPSSWDFHVISHTWSLEVRAFSEQVGQQIHRAEQGEGAARASLYNACFREADLRGEAAFQGLLHFLGLLAQAGVEYVWFDALCINQRDKQEKEREIANMGAYYHNSRGCYVIVHGIGRGYHFWNADDFVGALPRWFWRVWTLQELILPAHLLFVTQLPQRLQRLAHGLIQRRSSPSFGFCRCCILRDLLQQLRDALEPRARAEFLRSCGVEVEYTQSADEHGSGAAGNEIVFPSLSIPNSPLPSGDSTLMCPTCGSPSLIRQCEHHECAGQELYMIEREAYLFLMYLDTFFPLTFCYGNIPRIFALVRNLDEQNWDPANVFSDIGPRDCTNDEDRVLGVLGLLGVSGEMQIRTGKSAEEQLISLGKYCISKDPDLLLRLCVAEPVGGAIMGMSWAPSVRIRDFVYEHTGEVCGFSFDFIDGIFGDEIEQDLEASSSSVAKHTSQPLAAGEQRPLDMSVVKDSMDHLLLQLDRLSDRKREVEFLDCSADGITLEACVATGKVVPYTRLLPQEQATIRDALNKDNTSEPSILKDSHIPTHCLHFEKSNVFLPLLVSLFQDKSRASGEDEPVVVMADAMRPWNMMYLTLGNCKRAREALAGRESFLHSVEDGRVRIEMDVWVLMLGSVSSLMYSLWMVCVGYDDEVMEMLSKEGLGSELRELSKVGIMVLPTSLSNQIMNVEGRRARYLLGGHGDDLSMFVRMRCIKCGKLGWCACGRRRSLFKKMSKLVQCCMC